MSEYLTLFSSLELKDIVQDMRELLSQSRLAFLLGAGCSEKAGLPLMPELTKEVLVHDKIGEETKKLLYTVRKLFSGAEDATIEDFMSEIVDLLSIAVASIAPAKNNVIILDEIGKMECFSEVFKQAATIIGGK